MYKPYDEKTASTEDRIAWALCQIIDDDAPLHLHLVADLLHEEQRVQQQSHNQWITENLEEAQRIIDNIVGIKGITEDPLKAAMELGISSHAATAATADRKQQPQRKLLEERIMSRLTTSREHDFIALCDDQGSMPFECGR
jgi:hypothetical protein